MSMNQITAQIKIIQNYNETIMTSKVSDMTQMYNQYLTGIQK